MISDVEYFSHLYEIASTLNKEFSLHSALKKALEKTVQLLELETGWIWLLNMDHSVYLAASYNLPPVLRDHPEKLSGSCYCIVKYFSDSIGQATNISEIACTRLRNIKSGTMDLKFHATIPISVNNQKTGLINLLSKESQQLSEKQLNVLNTVSELIGMAIQRTQVQDVNATNTYKTQSTIHEVLGRAFSPRLKSIVSGLDEARDLAQQGNIAQTLESVTILLNEAQQLNSQLAHILQESKEDNPPARKSKRQFQFPASPLTDRELELLKLVKTGFTNKHIAETLFISERTVKFHVTSILSKLSATTRTEAVDIALKRGLISY